MTRHKELAAITTMTLLGAALRFYLIGAQSLWFDELLSLSISRLGLHEVMFSPASIDPPLYYIVLHFWMGLAHDGGMVRILSAVAGIAAIPTLYALGAQLLNPRVGLMAAFIFAIAPLQIYFAQEVRMYSWLVFFSILATWAYSRAQTFDRRRDWVLWIVTMSLALYTHNYAGLILVALALDALLRWRNKTGNLKRATISSFIVGLVFLPWFILLLQKLEWLIPALWLLPPTLLHLVVTLVTFTYGYTLEVLPNIIGMVVLISVLFFIVGSTWRVFRRGHSRERSSLTLLFLVLLVPLLITFLVSQWKPVYGERLLVEAAPALYLLLAWGIVQSDRRRIIRVGALIGLLLVLIADVAYFTQPQYARPPMRQVIQYVADHRAPDELVIHTSDSSFLAGRYYDAQGKHILLYHPANQWLIPRLMDELHVPYEMDALRLMAGQKSFWVVVALDHILDEQRAEKAFFDRTAVLVEQEEIRGISILRYHSPQSEVR